MNKMRSPLITFMAPKNKHPQTVNIMYQESATEKVPKSNQINISSSKKKKEIKGTEFEHWDLQTFFIARSLRWETVFSVIKSLCPSICSTIIAISGQSGKPFTLHKDPLFSLLPSKTLFTNTHNNAIWYQSRSKGLY